MRQETRDKVVVALLLASGFGVGVALMSVLPGCAGKVTLFEVHWGEAGSVETSKRPNGETTKQGGAASDSLEEDPRWELLND